MGIFTFWPRLSQSSVLTRPGEAYQTKRCFHFAYRLKWAWAWCAVRLTLKSPHSSHHMDVYCCTCVCRTQRGENDSKMLGKQWCPRTECKKLNIFLKISGRIQEVNFTESRVPSESDSWIYRKRNSTTS